MSNVWSDFAVLPKSRWCHTRRIQQTSSCVTPDFSRSDYFCAYSEFVVALKTAKAAMSPAILKVGLIDRDWISVTTTIAIILIAKPHSCDVERLTSAHTFFLKMMIVHVVLREQSIPICMRIIHNVPVLSEFDVWLRRKTTFCTPESIKIRYLDMKKP